jgi:chromosome segregation ATPase
MKVGFNEYLLACGGGNYGYTMKIENNMCTWSSPDLERKFPGSMASYAPYNVPSYIPKSVKELIMLIGKSACGATQYVNYTANEIKKILTVTLKDELDDIILHHVKELKETENKLKDSDNKLKETVNKLKDSDNKLKETVDKFLLLQNTHNDLIINNNNLKNNYINDKKEIINKFKSETARLINDEKEIIKKCKLETTELLNKNSRIQSNNLEITIENKKLSRQLEDITELYELLLTKQSDNKLEETENKLKESNDKLEKTKNKLKESNDKLEETKNKLTEIHELYNFVLYHTKETDNKLTESNDKLEKTENELKESINNMQFYESLLTKQSEKLKETENKLKELYDKQKKDENSGWGILSLFFQK